MKKKLVLWVGPKHSGKTTSVARLAQKAKKEGFNVAGVLAPSVYVGENLAGFEVADLRTDNKVSLATRKIDQNQQGGFNLTRTGLEFGKNALSIEAIKAVELVIVDEFGPLELEGKGWRENVDLLFSAVDALMLLVVRDQIADRVQDLYKDMLCLQLDAAEPRSVTKVIELLNLNRSKNER